MSREIDEEEKKTIRKLLHLLFGSAFKRAGEEADDSERAAAAVAAKAAGAARRVASSIAKPLFRFLIDNRKKKCRHNKDGKKSDEREKTSCKKWAAQDASLKTAAPPRTRSLSTVSVGGGESS